MTLPNYPITPIPDTAPSATPSLWNMRYTEIDENFDTVDASISEINESIAAIEPAVLQLQASNFPIYFNMFAF
jgi:hypothetical protein